MGWANSVSWQPQTGEVYRTTCPLNPGLSITVLVDICNCITFWSNCLHNTYVRTTQFAPFLAKRSLAFEALIQIAALGVFLHKVHLIWNEKISVRAQNGVVYQLYTQELTLQIHPVVLQEPLEIDFLRYVKIRHNWNELPSSLITAEDTGKPHFRTWN